MFDKPNSGVLIRMGYSPPGIASISHETVSGLEVVPVTEQVSPPTDTDGSDPKLDPSIVREVAPEPDDGLTAVIFGLELDE